MTPPPDFAEQARALGVELEPGDAERLGHFLGLMLEENKTTNLTAITDPAEAWTKHILDAVSLVPVLAQLDERRAGEELAGPREVADVGTGGGVPGIPLAILLPHLRFTLVEATGRKTEFLHRAIAALGLTNIEVVNDRAERIGQLVRSHKPGGRTEWFRDRFDAAIARALGHLAIVAELCVPLVKPPDSAKAFPGGLVIAVKGAKADQELAEAETALKLLRAVHVDTLQTPTGRLVLLERTAAIPRLYPRRDGEPKRVPLGMARKPGETDRLNKADKPQGPDQPKNSERRDNRAGPGPDRSRRSM